jgi:hypothetical protein
VIPPKPLRLAFVELWPSNTIASQLGHRHTTVVRALRDRGAATERTADKRPSVSDAYVPSVGQKLFN